MMGGLCTADVLGIASVGVSLPAACMGVFIWGSSQYGIRLGRIVLLLQGIFMYSYIMMPG